MECPLPRALQKGGRGPSVQGPAVAKTPHQPDFPESLQLEVGAGRVERAWAAEASGKWELKGRPETPRAVLRAGVGEGMNSAP